MVHLTTVADNKKAYERFGVSREKRDRRGLSGVGTPTHAKHLPRAGVGQDVQPAAGTPRSSTVRIFW